MSDPDGSSGDGTTRGNGPAAPARPQAAGERQQAPGGRNGVDAIARLDAALAALEAAVDHHVAHHVDNKAAAAEVQRLNADRARLARSLDEAEARAGRLDEANREVSRRLVGAMEAVRTVLEKQAASKS